MNNIQRQSEEADRQVKFVRLVNKGKTIVLQVLDTLLVKERK